MHKWAVLYSMKLKELSKGKEEPQSEFKPPKLPFTWLAASFAAPLFYIVINVIFTTESISWSIRIIIALSMLSILLFVACMRLMLNSYDMSYSAQTHKFKTELLKEEVERLIAETKEQRGEMDRYIPLLKQTYGNIREDTHVTRTTAIPTEDKTETPK